jgi:hypothetical protein
MLARSVGDFGPGRLRPATCTVVRLVLAGVPARCRASATADHAAFARIAGGAASATRPLPNVPALAGVVLRQQMVVVELGAVPIATSSPAVLLTLGAF